MGMLICARGPQGQLAQHGQIGVGQLEQLDVRQESRKVIRLSATRQQQKLR